MSIQEVTGVGHHSGSTLGRCLCKTPASALGGGCGKTAKSAISRLLTKKVSKSLAKCYATRVRQSPCVLARFNRINASRRATGTR
jgi:hypothetical protein